MALPFLEIAEKKKELRLRSYLNQGICYMNMNQIVKAQQKFQSVVDSGQIEETSSRLWAHYHLASIYESKGDVVKAIRHWETVDRINANFKDVPEKLKNYGDLRRSDLVKDYMICSMKQFRDISEYILTALSLEVHDFRSSSSHNEKLFYVCKEETKMMLGMKTLFKYVVFNRSGQSVTDEESRKCLEASKRFRCNEVIYITTAIVSPSCTSYIQNRPIQLVTGKKLNALLTKAVGMDAVE